MTRHRCHCTLAPMSSEGVSPTGRRLLTGGNRKFPSRLPYRRADLTVVQEETAEHMSISGVQDKISMRLERGKLIPVERDGRYILKPAPSRPLPRFLSDVPANEHLTMQIAAQIFGISTAANACVLLADGSMAYVVKRFDYRDGAKVSQEDFCQLASRSPETHGKTYKYDASYEETGRVLKRFCKAYAVEVEKLFRMILFDYVFSNGDAHLKNFSLQESPDGDYVLTPAYDLICTSLHIPNESRTALDLFDDYESPFYLANGFYGREDFVELAARFAMLPARAESIIDSHAKRRRDVSRLIDWSFLSNEAKLDYRSRHQERLKAIT